MISFMPSYFLEAPASHIATAEPQLLHMNPDWEGMALGLLPPRRHTEMMFVYTGSM